MIYIHVPFCKSRCIYCDFYSTTLSGDRILYVDRVLEEAAERSRFFDKAEEQKYTAYRTAGSNPEKKKHKVRTLYIGGGTPSQLPVTEITRLVEGISRIFDLSETEEFTIEVNPEDITESFVRNLHPQINRISMGVQSFVDEELRILNRRHNAARPAEAVRLLQDISGITNISIDLMYGLPQQTLESFSYSIDHAVELGVTHISAYNLSVEQGTRLERLVNDGNLSIADDDLCVSMNELLRQKLKNSGFIQYEISNYARPGFESQHNSRYWTGDAYIGLGPGAHSYDGQRERSWNDPDLISYLNGKRHHGSEILTDTDIVNERIMLGLRTSRGFDRTKLSLPLDAKVLSKLIERNLIVTSENYIRLTQKGLALADEVIRDLILI